MELSTSSQRCCSNCHDGKLASISFGTDWGALAAAWLTEWERTGNEKVKNKLLNSMRTIAAQPHGFFTGVSTIDLNTGKFLSADASQLSVSHLSTVFGLTEICAELIQTFDIPNSKKHGYNIANCTMPLLNNKKPYGRKSDQIEPETGTFQADRFCGHAQKG